MIYRDSSYTYYLDKENMKRREIPFQKKQMLDVWIKLVPTRELLSNSDGTVESSGTYYLYSKSSALRVFAIEKSSGSSSSSSGSSSSGGSSSSTGSAISFKPTSLSAGALTENATYGSFQVLASSLMAQTSSLKWMRWLYALSTE